MFINNTEAFIDFFKMKFPDMCRKLTVDNVRLMTECSLIGRYKYYLRQDLEIVRRILHFEELREHRSAQQDKEKKSPCCKSCGQPLPPNSEGKLGQMKK